MAWYQPPDAQPDPSWLYANWDKIPQTRPFVVKGDQLSYKVAAATGGGTAEVVWRRIK